MNIDEAVVIRTYASEMLANIAASRLESGGIEAHIHKDDCGGAYPSLQMSGGVRLLVRPEDLEDAEKILNEMDAADSGEVEEEEEKKQQEDSKKSKSNPLFLIGLFVLGLAIGYFLSPELTDRSTYTGVIKKDRNAAGKYGTFFHYVGGKLVRAEEDRNYDGKIDAWHKYVAGKMSTSAFDDKFTGPPNRWITYKDPFNYVEKVDTDFDGKPDVTVYYVNGLVQRKDWHPGDSAIIERREFYEHGVLKEVLFDTNKDGIFNLKTTYDRYERPVETSKCWIPEYSERP